MLLSTADASAANNDALPLKGRLILAFLRALVGAFKAGKTFVVRNTGFGGGIGCRVDRRLHVKSRHAGNRTGRSPEEMLPMIRLRLEARPFAYNRSHPGRAACFRNMLYRMLFPRLHP